MKGRPIILMLAASLLSSCGNLNSLNSFSSDPEIYDLSISARFAAARQLLSGKCSSCHQAFVSYSEAEWISTGQVVAGSASTSALYLRLKSNGIPGSDQDMPPNSSLSVAEAAIIQDWIDSL